MHHPSPADLIDFIHAALPPEDDARVHLHLAACSDCRGAYRHEVALGEMLRRAARAEERELPALVKARILQAVHHETAISWTAHFASGLRPLFAVPVAAAVLFAASLALPTLRAPAPTSAIDAQFYLDAYKAQSAGNPLSEHSGVTAAFDASLSETRAADARH